MRISVLVPYRAGEPHRDRAWAFNRARWEALVPEAEIVVCADDGGAHPGEFNHPRAINYAAMQSSGDVLVIADADTTFDSPMFVRAAAMLCYDEAVPWALPTTYVKISERATAAGLDSGFSPNIATHAEWVGRNVSWSGLVFIGRDRFQIVGGYDERIAWWGADDVCFAATANTMFGDVVRVPGAAMHLWHPQPLDETYGHERHRAQQELVDRYIEASGNYDLIRTVRFA